MKKAVNIGRNKGKRRRQANCNDTHSFIVDCVPEQGWGLQLLVTAHCGALLLTERPPSEAKGQRVMFYIYIYILHMSHIVIWIE